MKKIELLVIAILCWAGSASAQFVLNQIAITGDPVPGAADLAEFESFFPPALNSAGDVAFSAKVSTGSKPGAQPVDFSNDDVILGPISGVGSSLTILAREGEPAPGADDLAEFGLIPFQPALNDFGDVAFSTSLTTGSSPGAIPVSNNNDAIIGPSAGANSPTGIVAREGDQVPGATDLSEYSLFFDDPLSINNSGDVTFWGEVRTGDTPGAIPVGSRNNEAVFGPVGGPGSSIGIVAREGEVAPGATDLAEFRSFERPLLNVNADVAFRASLRGGNGPGDNLEAIFGPTSGPGSPLGLLVREGDTAPGATDNAAFDNLESVAFNDSSDIAFSVELRIGTGPGATPVARDNDRAIFGPTAGPGSPLGLVVRSGDAVPGVSDFAEFDSFNHPALNSVGDVAFDAKLRAGTGEPVTMDNDGALVASFEGVLTVVLREGDVIPVETPTGLTEPRTVARSIGFGQDGLNDAGVIAVRLEFTDGSQGIFTITRIPEPTAAALALLAVGCGIARFSRTPPPPPA